MDFLEKLNYLMKEQNLNKSTLSKACNIPYTTIDGWYKKGYEGLKLTTLKKLAAYFGTSLDYWAADDMDIPTSNLVLNKKEQQILILYNDLNTEGQEKLIDYADDLVASGRYKKIDTIELEQKEA